MYGYMDSLFTSSSIERHVFHVGGYVTKVLETVFEDARPAGPGLGLVQQRDVVLELLDPPGGFVAPMESDRGRVMVGLLQARVAALHALHRVVERLLVEVLAEERLELGHDLHER